MLEFREDYWQDSNWASIEISPIDLAYLPKILLHLATTFGLGLSEIVDIVNGYVLDFEILGSPARVHVDNWFFSIGFEDEAVRNEILSELQSLPSGYFEIQTSAFSPKDISGFDSAWLQDG
ncbi:MAG: hypothetical protein JXB07_06465 [Anaerolineae bacterium]|nr:hypothetical protein [Anaerolineae bacterium]